MLIVLMNEIEIDTMQTELLSHTHVLCTRDLLENEYALRQQYRPTLFMSTLFLIFLRGESEIECVENRSLYVHTYNHV